MEDGVINNPAKVLVPDALEENELPTLNGGSIASSDLSSNSGLLARIDHLVSPIPALREHVRFGAALRLHGPGELPE